MRRPLAWAGISFLLAQWLLQRLPSVAHLPLAVILLLLFVMFCRKKTKSFEKALVCGAALAAAIWLMLYQLVFVSPILRRQGYEGEIKAVVESVRPGYSEERVRAVLNITSIDKSAAAFKAVCDDFPAVEAGEEVSANALFYRYSHPRDQGLYYPDGVFMGVECTDVTDIRETRSFTNRLYKLQNAASNHLQRTLPGENGEIMAALITGDAQAVRRETKLRFQKAGVSHIMVVSGLHLSITALGLWGILKKLFPGRKIAAVLSLAALAGYMLFTGMSPSVVRAGIMVGMVLVGELAGRKSDSLTALGAAALVLTAANPYAASDAGVLFSFTATLGVLYAGKIKGRFYGKKRKKLTQIFLTVCGLLLTPFCAMLFTLPVQIWIGGSVSVFGIFANLLIVPLMPPLLLMGVLVLFTSLAPGLSAVSGFFVFITEGLLFVIKQTAGLVAEIPFGRIGLSGGFAFVVLLTITGVGVIIVKRKKRLLAAVVCLCLLLVSCGTYRLLTEGTVTAAAVGYGKNPALVVTRHHCAVVLFRGGDSNAYAVQRYLDEKNISDIVYLVNMEKRIRTELFKKVFGRDADINVREEMFFRETKPLFHDIILEMERHPSGAVCRIWVEGYQLLITAGGTDLRGAPKATVFLPGSAKAIGARYDAVLCTRTLPAWMTPEEDVPVYTDQDTPEIFIRPGKSLYIRQGG